MPLILVPLLMRWLPESAVFAGEKQAAPPLRLICARNGNRDAAAVVVLFLHSAGGLYVDQLATATISGARIPAIAGGRGDVCPANGCGKWDVNVGCIDG